MHSLGIAIALQEWAQGCHVMAASSKCVYEFRANMQVNMQQNRVVAMTPHSEHPEPICLFIVLDK
jgi:hypothetical protein